MPLSSTELVEWMAFKRLAPFGSLIDDYRAGLYTSVKVNSARGENSTLPYYGPLDFWPWQRPLEEQRAPGGWLGPPAAEPEPMTSEDVAGAILAELSRTARKND